MLLTPHALVGVSIGASTDNIPLIIVLAFLSHFILDMIPHFDWGTWHKEEDFKLELKDYLLVGFDGLMMILVLNWLWNNNNFDNLMLWGSFSAILVDLIDNVPFWKNWIRNFFPFNKLHLLHKLVQYRLKLQYWYWGVITQLIVIVVSLLVIRLLPK